MKSNKSDFYIMRGKLEKMFIPNEKFDDIMGKYQSFEDDMNNALAIRDQAIQNFREETYKDMESQILEICRKKLDGFVKVEKEFSKYFNTEQISQILDNKADYECINTLNHTKASIGDINDVKDLIDSLNERVK